MNKDIFEEEPVESKNVNFYKSQIEYFKERKINASKLMRWFLNNYQDYKDFKKQEKKV